MSANGSDTERHGGKRQCIRNDENWKCRVNLAAVFQLMDNLKFNEAIENHLSLIAPAQSGEGEVMLINAFGTHWSQVTASNLIGVDLETGKTLEGKGHAIPPAVSLHRAILKSNPKGRCIMHTHQPYVAALNCLKDPRLLMVHQASCQFCGKIAYDDNYNGVTDDQEGERLAQLMKDKEILFQSNHGVTAVGPTVAYTFGQLYYLERACMYQMMAMNTGRPLKEIPLDVVLETKKSLDQHNSGETFLNAMKDVLVAKGSNFNC